MTEPRPVRAPDYGFYAAVLRESGEKLSAAEARLIAAALDHAATLAFDATEFAEVQRQNVALRERLEGYEQAAVCCRDDTVFCDDDTPDCPGATLRAVLADEAP